MDKIIRCITSDGSLMASAIDSTEIVKVAQEVHQLTRTSCAALGRLLTGTSMMGAMLKSMDASVTVKVNGGGQLGNLVAISDSNGNVRGYVDHPEVDMPLKSNGKIDVGGAVGQDGRLAVLKDLGTGDPYIGQVNLVSGEIAEDITNYYAVSEQIPTVCALGVLVNKDTGMAMLSGGLLIQVLPGADDSAISKLEGNLSQLDSVTTMLAKGMSPEEMCRTALQGFEVEKLDEFAVHYVCTCSKKRYAQALMTLGAEEVRNFPLNEDGNAEAVCHYCGKKYYFSREELEKIASEIELQKKV
jgi:molecular chaperone Hsp33